MTIDKSSSKTTITSNTFNDFPRMLIITSCTGEKRFKPTNQLTLEDFKDSNRLNFRQEELKEFVLPASQMYTGQQHLRCLEGIQCLRQAFGRKIVDLQIFSAGYGLISEERKIAPYEVTFNSMRISQIDEWSKFLGVHQAFQRAISNYDLLFILLGKKYLQALAFPVETLPGQTLVFLASESSTTYVQNLAAKSFVFPLSKQQAKHYQYGLVGLKGFLFKQFSEKVVQCPELLKEVYQNPQIIKEVFVPDYQQLELPIEVKKINKNSSKNKKNTSCQPKAENLIKKTNFEFQLYDLPPASNIHLGMQYFIPEWDDTVDPNYDFVNDIHAPGRNVYQDEYAHEIFSQPNYDGILVSKTIVDKIKKKKDTVEEIGIHKYIRFPGKIMGDCGAFGYIKEDTPPYTSEQVLDYYLKGGFDYGVSVDHLIVGPFAEPGIREKRYKLTVNNAYDFLRKHQARGCGFTPIGAVQGWNPETYAEAVKDYIEMGYDYIALGGLARAQTKEIIEILKAVHPHLTPKTRLHLFGVGRINAVRAFRHLGVTSFDSASPLRKAWLGSNGDNYNSLVGEKYAAIRVPPVDGHGLRVRRLLEAGVADRETLKNLEKNALKALREFDLGNSTLDETLESILAYDELVELPRNGQVNPKKQAERRARHEIMYRKLLEDKPWKNCNCPICKTLQIEVVIFRGNNRNRRRGFHNTYIFYQLFKELIKDNLSTEDLVDLE